MRFERHVQSDRRDGARFGRSVGGIKIGTLKTPRREMRPPAEVEGRCSGVEQRDARVERLRRVVDETHHHDGAIRGLLRRNRRDLAVGDRCGEGERLPSRCEQTVDVAWWLQPRLVWQEEGDALPRATTNVTPM